ncbi:MFS transporter [Agrobacterium tumefaciens]|uniref:MFS transporter n=1 Tax=Agrobacterium tumefaciens TaxID=358 RepID=UPI003BA0EE61
MEPIETHARYDFRSRTLDASVGSRLVNGPWRFQPDRGRNAFCQSTDSDWGGPRHHGGHGGSGFDGNAVVAFFTSIFVAVLTRRLDRRNLLLWLSVIQIVSNLIVAFAPNLAVLLIGRMFLGLSLAGGNCSVSARGDYIVGFALPQQRTQVRGSFSRTRAPSPG